MKKYGDVEIHKAKTDKNDALRIARFALEKSYCLTPYISMEQKYEDLKYLSRQYSQHISLVTKIKVQLLTALDETMPGITNHLTLRSKELKKCPLLLLVMRFKSFDEINKMRKSRVLSAYATLIKKATDRYAPSKELAIYELAHDSITTRGEGPYVWSTQLQCIELLTASQNVANEIIVQMQNIAQTIPKYQVMLSMRGISNRLGPMIFG